MKALIKWERVVVSHWSTNPALTNHPWYARTVNGPDSILGNVIAMLLQDIDVPKTAKIYVVYWDANFLEGLRTNFGLHGLNLQFSFGYSIC